ncbi:MAG: Dabb family protein [Syntrophotaleaceae bacterium]
MIRHIVLFSAKDPADIETILEGLSILKEIPGSCHFEVACNSKRDGLSQEIDVIVYGEFDSYEELDAYKAHPFYQESIKRVRPLRELRYAVDFAAAPGCLPLGTPQRSQGDTRGGQTALRKRGGGRKQAGE